MFLDRQSLWHHLRRWEGLAADADGPFRLRFGTLFVADADAARDVLVDSADRYLSQSGFYRLGLVPLPQGLRAEASHELLKVLARHGPRASFDVGSALREAGDSRGRLRHQRWGVQVVRRYFAPVIAHPRHREINALVDAYVTSSVVADDIVGHVVRRSHRSVPRIRAGFADQLGRLPPPDDGPRDLVDVVLRLPGELSPADRAQLLQRLVLSTVGFTGVALEWVVLLGVRHGYDDPAVRPEQVRSLVKEALRLYPTAWRLLRVAAADHEIAGVPVREGEHVLIGTHALHRSAAVWDEPLRFRPARWENPTDEQRRSYLPFGKGKGMCPANGFAVRALEHLGSLILRGYRGEVRLCGRKPHARTLLAPPAGWTRLTGEPRPERQG
ncbi:cytochrome P450 [Streptomyces sp. TRM 70351]|uniref:cytochrome P450 n=1 Tax=Streptomyces sp. TRM 70351 TaxID=3116552 RepID=UPI002E7ADF14|nr:cytochrome P450 [Streptomyces sp. TRM 70351]MEE1929611.1 cytochrome P450 [Streptomyces sp. TRM 70351]